MRTTLGLGLALGLALTIGPTATARGQATVTKGTTKTKTAEMPAKAVAREKLDLNTATVAQLDELPGMTSTIAREIVRARPHRSIDDLKSLKGVTPTLFAGLAPRVKVGEAEAKKVALPPGRKIDLNAAPVEELEELPGIGPARAAAIVKARPFARVEDVARVAGISPALYAEIAPHLRVAEPPAAKGTVPRNATKEATRKETTVTKEATRKEAMSKTTAAKEATKEDTPEHQRRKKAALAAGRKINLNTATVEELEELPGIGPVRSAAIVKARPFETIEDVMKVEGIKEGIFGQIKDHISVK